MATLSDALRQFDDNSLDRMTKELIHPIPGDASFLAAAGALLRAMLQSELGSRRLAASLRPSTVPEATGVASAHR